MYELFLFTFVVITLELLEKRTQPFLLVVALYALGGEPCFSNDVRVSLVVGYPVLEPFDGYGVGGVARPHVAVFLFDLLDGGVALDLGHDGGGRDHGVSNIGLVLQDEFAFGGILPEHLFYEEAEATGVVLRQVYIADIGRDEIDDICEFYAFNHVQVRAGLAVGVDLAGAYLYHYYVLGYFFYFLR